MGGRQPMAMAVGSSLELTMAMASSLDMELLVTVATTEAMLAMEESTMATMASVRLIPMPTPLAWLPMASLCTMPMLLAILTMSESLPDTDTPDTEAMLDTEVTLDTSTDKCLPGHC